MSEAEMTVGEAAGELGVSRWRVHQMLKEKRLVETVHGRNGPGAGTRISRASVDQVKRERLAALREQLRLAGG